MSKSTPATLALTRAGAVFTLHAYDYDPSAERIGLQAAEALGEAASRVLKTLMTRVDGKSVCVVLASDKAVAMKKLATGYRIGGVSPFGQKRKVTTVLDRTALDEPYVFVNAGQRGLQARLAPDALSQALDAVIADVGI
jgi:Cys-tRNA(Pro)/Cys-tRNA(Cys) deacylase